MAFKPEENVSLQTLKDVKEQVYNKAQYEIFMEYMEDNHPDLIPGLEWPDYQKGEIGL